MKILWLCRFPEIVLGSLDPTLRIALHKDDKHFKALLHMASRVGFWNLVSGPVRNLSENSDNSFPLSFCLSFLCLFLETGNSFLFWVHLWNRCFCYCYNLFNISGRVCSEGGSGNFLYHLSLWCWHKCRIMCLTSFCFHSFWHHSISIVVNILGNYTPGGKIEI